MNPFRWPGSQVKTVFGNKRAKQLPDAFFGFPVGGFVQGVDQQGQPFLFKSLLYLFIGAAFVYIGYLSIGKKEYLHT